MAPLRAPSGPLLNEQAGRADQDSIESMTTAHRDLNQLVALNPIAIATFRRYLDGGCASHVIRPCCHRSSSTRAIPNPGRHTGADGLQQLPAYNRPLFLQPTVLHQLRILQCQCFPLRSRQSRSRTRPPFPRILRAIALASAFHDAGISGKRHGLLWL